MPIFDYFCPSCESKYEARVKKYDDPTHCPQCNTVGEKRLSMPAFILKGPGFYSSGSFAKAKDGPKLDKDLLRLDDVSLNRELGLPDDCA